MSIALALDPALTQPLTTSTIALRLGLAVGFGVVIGLERKIADKPADVRTMALISAGAAAFTLMGVEIAAHAVGVPGMQTDPTRVLAYIISGVGFLGAGTILHSKKTIKGLTTAAAIWAAAAVGAACGLGHYTIATALFLIIFVMLWVPWTMRLMGFNGHEAEAAGENGHPGPQRRTHDHPGHDDPDPDGHEPHEAVFSARG